MSAACLYISGCAVTGSFDNLTVCRIERQIAAHLVCHEIIRYARGAAPCSTRAHRIMHLFCVGTNSRCSNHTEHRSSSCRCVSEVLEHLPPPCLQTDPNHVVMPPQVQQQSASSVSCSRGISASCSFRSARSRRCRPNASFRVWRQRLICPSGKLQLWTSQKLTALPTLSSSRCGNRTPSSTNTSIRGHGTTPTVDER